MNHDGESGRRSPRGAVHPGARPEPAPFAPALYPLFPPSLQRWLSLCPAQPGRGPDSAWNLLPAHVGREAVPGMYTARAHSLHRDYPAHSVSTFTLHPPHTSFYANMCN